MLKNRTILSERDWQEIIADNGSFIIMQVSNSQDNIAKLEAQIHLRK